MSKTERRPVPRHFIPIIATVFVMLFLWLSAVPLLSWYEFNNYEQELRYASNKWAGSNIASYRFRYEISSYYAPPVFEPVYVLVHDAEPVHIYTAATGEEIDLSRFANAPATIESFHETIAKAVSMRPHKIDVEYDEEYGYPSSIVIDLTEDGHDQVRHSISEFEVESDGL